jgi:diguanylate cyclase (GGDEF)-like protein/PAS domain S-box-containing protein
MARRSFSYALYGALIGLLFPLVAMAVEAVIRGMPLSLLSFGQLQTSSPLFWMIDGAPVLLSLVASLAGRQRDRLARLTGRLENEIGARTEEIVRQNRFFEALVANSPIAIVTLDRNHNVTSLNPAFQSIFGYTLEEMKGKNLDPFVADERRLTEAVNITSQVLKGETVRDTAFRKRKDGSLVYVDIQAVPVMLGGELIGVMGLYADITERKRAEDALRESESQYRSLFDDSPVSLFEEDFSGVKEYIDNLREEGVSDIGAYLKEHPAVVAYCASLVKITNVNQACVELYGAESKEDLLVGLSGILAEESLDVFGEELVSLAEGETNFEAILLQRTFDDERIHAAFRLSIAPGHAQKWDKVLVSVLDITDRVRLEERLQQMLEDSQELARTDPLTGLLNRRAITEHLEAEINRASREGAALTLMIFDLDNLKEINDAHGHQFGDESLIAFARALELSRRKYDWLGRWGGDEFLMILPGVGSENACKAADRLLSSVRMVELRPSRHSEVKLSTSIGVASWKGAQGEEISADALLRDADMALLEAKNRGRDRACFAP